MMYKYVGEGDHMPGIPARDLTEDEYNDLDPARQADVEGSDLYKFVDDKPQTGGGKK